VGRPNVGKSTLFNRLTEGRAAIVHETSGVTRDRHYGKSVWNGIDFSVIDTGGYVEGSDDVFEEEIRKQVLLAIEEADLLLFMVDVNEGITDLDKAVADLLRRSKKKTLLVVNKVDSNMKQYEGDIFYSLGLGELYKISSITGSGTGELLDDLVKSFYNNRRRICPSCPGLRWWAGPMWGSPPLLMPCWGRRGISSHPLQELPGIPFLHGTTNSTMIFSWLTPPGSAKRER
jgi:small GTP-binding protein